MSTTSLEYLLVAGKALARAEWQSGRTITPEDVRLAAQETAKQMVAAQRISATQVEGLIADLPPAWLTATKFDTGFFSNLHDATMLGVDLKGLEPLIEGVSAAIKQVSAARTQQAAQQARANIPAELQTPVGKGMTIDAIAAQVEAAFAHPAFRQEIGADARTRIDPELARAVFGLAGPSAVVVVSSRNPGKPLNVPVFTLPIPTTTHDLALHLVAANHARQLVDEPGFDTAVLGQRSLASSGHGPGGEWQVYTAKTDKGIVVGLEVTNIDETLRNFHEPPARDQAMEERIASYVSATAKAVMDDFNAGTPLLLVKRR